MQSQPTLGILGGGQLARMLVQAATKLGCAAAVMESDPHAPAMQIATHAVTGNWNDLSQAREFSRRVDILTLENEFVNADLLAALEADGVVVRPGAATLRTAQDKLLQRRAFAEAGLPVPDFQAVISAEQLVALGGARRWPLVLKTRRNGYDGRGTAVIASAAEVPAAWERLRGNENSVYAEDFCAFERELAVVVCRSATGQLATYPVVETIQENHVCRVVRAPAAIPDQVAAQARTIASGAVETLDGVGCFGVELFLRPDGGIVINEVAPRVHNSGHYTIEACACSQFENHVRVVMGWPMGSTTLRSPAAMVNVLSRVRGKGHPDGLTEALKVPGAHIHLYGKRGASPGRKMGHVTALAADVEQAVAIAEQAARTLQFSFPA